MVKKIYNNYITEDNIVKIELKRRDKESLWTIIDIDDLDKVMNFPYSWHTHFNKNNGQYYARAVIYKPEPKEYYGCCGIRLHDFLIFGSAPNEYIVDHINHDSLDNRKENLRATTISHNDRFRKGRNKNNKSGYRNVALINGKYCVQIQINGKNAVLGRFDNIEDAVQLAEKARIKYYGKFAGESA